MSSMILPLTGFRARVTSLFRDYAELTKLRVTSLIVMTAWCGYFFGAHKAGESWFSFGLLNALIGIGLVSSGTAALNEVMEHDVDGHMRRTALRPIPAGRMSLAHAMIVGLLMSVGGSFYLAIFTNPLTGLLTFLTSVVYLVAYTPLKRVSPICTFVGKTVVGHLVEFTTNGSLVTTPNYLVAALNSPSGNVSSYSGLRTLTQAVIYWAPPST